MTLFARVPIALAAFIASWSCFAAIHTSKILLCPSCECAKDEIGFREQYAGPGKFDYREFMECYAANQFTGSLEKCFEDLKSLGARVDCTSVDQLMGSAETCGFDFPPTEFASYVSPKGCGYEWQKFNFKQFAAVVKNSLDSGALDCTTSMCTSAAFLAFTAHAKKLHRQGKISDATYRKLTTLNDSGTDKDSAWSFINKNATPNDLVETYHLGKGVVQYSDQFGDEGYPKSGDLVQIWRKNNSGHSVVFKGFLYQPGTQKPYAICYWSSQTKTNGYGNRCETMDDIDRLLIGSFNEI